MVPPRKSHMYHAIRHTDLKALYLCEPNSMHSAHFTSATDVICWGRAAFESMLSMREP